MKISVGEKLKRSENEQDKRQGNIFSLVEDEQTLVRIETVKAEILKRANSILARYEQTDGRISPETAADTLLTRHLAAYVFAANEIVKRGINDKNVLDVGSGEGYGAFFLSQLGFSPAMIDYDKRALETARERYNETKIIQADARFLPIKENSYGTVILFQVIEHFDRDAQKILIQELLRVAKPDSIVIVSTNNKDYSAEDKPATEFHIDEFNHDDIINLGQWLKDNGLCSDFEVLGISCEEVERIKGLWLKMRETALVKIARRLMPKKIRSKIYQKVSGLITSAMKDVAVKRNSEARTALDLVLILEKFSENG